MTDYQNSDKKIMKITHRVNNNSFQIYWNLHWTVYAATQKQSSVLKWCDINYFP